MSNAKKKENWYKISLDTNPSGIYQKELNIPIPKTCLEIINSLNDQGYLSLVVGGAVRDALLGITSKDIDIEVYGLNYDTLAQILEPFGKIGLIGKTFGIVMVTDSEGNDYDFSIPRRENKTGTGHKDFTVEFDPSITPKEAASRRDFTINSLAYDALNQEIYDYFGGIDDLNNKKLKATSKAFAEDHLRVLRGMQFAARFGFDIEPETAEMCSTLNPNDLKIERITKEWMKLFTKGKYPEKLLQYLIDTEWIDFYPELKAIVGVSQDPEWHMEGDLVKHTEHSLKQAVRVAERDKLNGDDRAVLLLSALCHDLGKPEVTQEEEIEGKTRITSKGHDRLGMNISKQFMESVGIKKDIINQVVPLVGLHMAHINYENEGNTKKNNVLQMAERLSPATMEQLERLIEIDHSARPPLPGGIPEPAQIMFNDAKEKNVYQGKTTPFLQGRDIKHLFLAPGKIIGDTLKYVYDLQLQQVVKTKEEALKYADNFAMKNTLLVNGKDVLDLIDKIFLEKGIIQKAKGGEFVGKALKDVWEMQKEKSFKNREEALSWLEQDLIILIENGTIPIEKTPEEIEFETWITKGKKMNTLKFSEHNMNYRKHAQANPNLDIDPATIILQEFEHGRDNFGEVNWDKIKSSLNDDEMFGEVQSYWKSNPEHALETYQSIVDEDLKEEVASFLSGIKTAIKTPEEDIQRALRIEEDVPDDKYDLYMECLNNKPMSQRKSDEEIRSGCILTGIYEDIIKNSNTNINIKTAQVVPMPDAPLDISEIESAFGPNAAEAVKMVPTSFLQGIQRIGVTDNAAVAGVYRPYLTIYMYEQFLEQNGIHIEELSEEEKEQYFQYMKQLQDEQGIAFELSPQKIRSEKDNLINELRPYVDHLSNQMEPQELEKWLTDTENLIEQLVIAEIIVHESVHAHGEKGEGVPVAMEKAFLNQKILEINNQRQAEGIFPIPLTTK